jgi:hypothetical protein
MTPWCIVCGSEVEPNSPDVVTLTSHDPGYEPLSPMLFFYHSRCLALVSAVASSYLRLIPDDPEAH